MPRTKVSTARFTDSKDRERVQFKTTIPKGLAEAYDMEKAHLEWSAAAGNKLTVEVVPDDE